MAVAQVDVYNMALSAIGITELVATPTEASLAAQVCTVWYEKVRDSVMKAAPWSSLFATARLALKSTRDNDQPWQPTDPTPGYLYAYALPSDFLHPRYLTTYERFDLVSMADGQRAIMTNQELALMNYTKQGTDPSTWDPGLLDAVVFGLSAHIVKPITGKTSDMSVYFNLASAKISGARQVDAMPVGQMVETTPGWIQARG